MCPTTAQGWRGKPHEVLAHLVEGLRQLVEHEQLSSRRRLACCRESNRTIIECPAVITDLRDGFGGDEIGERAGAEPAVELVGEPRRADQVDSAFPDGGSLAQPLQM